MKNKILDEGMLSQMKKEGQKPLVSRLTGILLFCLWAVGLAILCIHIFHPMFGAYLSILLHVVLLYIGAGLTNFLLARKIWKPLVWNPLLYIFIGLHSTYTVAFFSHPSINYHLWSSHIIFWILLVVFGLLEAILFTHKDFD